LGAAAGLPLTAGAHALPQSAIPPEGAEVQTAPKVVEITFGEIPDPRLSTITVINSSGVNVDAGSTVVVPGHPLELEVALKSIGNGVCTVTWKTVSEVDGHLATGAYAFGVGVSAAGASTRAGKSVVSPPPSILAVAGRWLFFIGLMGHHRRGIDVPDRAARDSEVRQPCTARDVGRGCAGRRRHHRGRA